MVMNMKRRKHIRRRRFGDRKIRLASVPILFMAICYLAGVVLGCRFGILTEVPNSLFSILTEHVSSDEYGFLAVFGSYGLYGILFLLLSTTYLGFLLVPPVFAVKGFLMGTLFFAYLHSGQNRPYLAAGISLCLPELFIVSALFLLGNLCMHLSFQLLCRFRGAPAAAVGERHERVLAAIFILLLLAAVIETYVVPLLIRAVCT